MPDSTAVAVSENLSREIFAATKEGIVYLAEKIEQVAPTIWEIMVRKVTFEAIANFVPWLVLFVLGAIILTGGCFYYRSRGRTWDRLVITEGLSRYDTVNNESRTDYQFMSLAWIIAGGFFTAIGLIGSLINGVDLIKVLSVPEYYAMESFFKMIGVN